MRLCLMPTTRAAVISLTRTPTTTNLPCPAPAHPVRAEEPQRDAHLCAAADPTAAAPPVSEFLGREARGPDRGAQCVVPALFAVVAARCDDGRVGGFGAGVGFGWVFVRRALLFFTFFAGSNDEAENANSLSKPSPSSPPSPLPSAHRAFACLHTPRPTHANPNTTFLTECSFGVAHDALVHILTDVEPFEPHWEDLSGIDLAGRALESVTRLKEFLPRLDGVNLCVLFLFYFYFYRGRD